MEYNKEWYESTINKLQKLVNDLKDVYKDRIEEKEEITEYENDIKERMILLIESERKWDEETDTLIEEASDWLNRLSKLKGIKKDILFMKITTIR